MAKGEIIPPTLPATATQLNTTNARDVPNGIKHSSQLAHQASQHVRSSGQKLILRGPKRVPKPTRIGVETFKDGEPEVMELADGTEVPYRGPIILLGINNLAARSLGLLIQLTDNEVISKQEADTYITQFPAHSSMLSAEELWRRGAYEADMLGAYYVYNKKDPQTDKKFTEIAISGLFASMNRMAQPGSGEPSQPIPDGPGDADNTEWDLGRLSVPRDPKKRKTGSQEANDGLEANRDACRPGKKVRMSNEDNTSEQECTKLLLAYKQNITVTTTNGGKSALRIAKRSLSVLLPLVSNTKFANLDGDVARFQELAENAKQPAHNRVHTVLNYLEAWIKEDGPEKQSRVDLVVDIMRAVVPKLGIDVRKEHDKGDH